MYFRKKSWATVTWFAVWTPDLRSSSFVPEVGTFAYQIALVNVEYMDRFEKDFGVDVEEEEDDVEAKELKLNKPSKPSDFQALFGANNNDHFMVGIKFTRYCHLANFRFTFAHDLNIVRALDVGQITYSWVWMGVWVRGGVCDLCVWFCCPRKSVRLYSDFYSSDMIVASPLGLITPYTITITITFLWPVTSRHGTDSMLDTVNSVLIAAIFGFQKIGEAEANKEKDVDYLSSIEVIFQTFYQHFDSGTFYIILWAAIVILCVLFFCIRVQILIVDHADVISMQVYLDEQARFYRQTIILSSYLNPDINALFNRHCLNFEGKLRFSCDHKGVLPKVILQVKQVYERFNSDSILEVDDARLDYFIKKWDGFLGGGVDFSGEWDFGLLAFEWVVMWGAQVGIGGGVVVVFPKIKDSIQMHWKLTPYDIPSDGQIRGIQNLIIYSLPERKEFYPEILNMLEGSHDMTCTVLFSRFDQLRLERVVGSAAAKRMASSEKALFIFK
ncbi:Digestive organ expansion factor-like protein [Bienertia sinuspersici]